MAYGKIFLTRRLDIAKIKAASELDKKSKKSHNDLFKSVSSFRVIKTSSNLKIAELKV
jgi:hypothetical protein